MPSAWRSTRGSRTTTPRLRPRAWTSSDCGTRTDSASPTNCVAFVSVDEGGRIVDCGYEGGGLMGTTLVNLGAVRHRFQAVQLPDIQREPERGDGWVRFVQTCGGRTGVPAPRRVRRRPFVQWQAPLVWTTLSLTLHADGRSEHALIGASRFPRHWVYGRRQHALAQVGADRLQGLVPQVVRQAQPVG